MTEAVGLYVAWLLLAWLMAGDPLSLFLVLFPRSLRREKVVRRGQGGHTYRYMQSVRTVLELAPVSAIILQTHYRLCCIIPYISGGRTRSHDCGRLSHKYHASSESCRTGTTSTAPSFPPPSHRQNGEERAKVPAKSGRYTVEK